MNKIVEITENVPHTRKLKLFRKMKGKKLNLNMAGRTRGEKLDPLYSNYIK